MVRNHSSKLIHLNCVKNNVSVRLLGFCLKLDRVLVLTVGISISGHIQFFSKELGQRQYMIERFICLYLFTLKISLPWKLNSVYVSLMNFVVLMVCVSVPSHSRFPLEVRQCLCFVEEVRGFDSVCICLITFQISPGSCCTPALLQASSVPLHVVPLVSLSPGSSSAPSSGSNTSHTQTDTHKHTDTDRQKDRQIHRHIHTETHTQTHA